MSEVDQRTGEAPASGAEAAIQAGALLRSAREASGLHVAALAVSLKVPVHKLEALEAGRIDELPDAVFARALASSVCRTLKADPAPVLALLPSSNTPRLRTDETGINAPFRTPGESASQPALHQFLRPAPMLVLLLVVGALALLFLPQLHWERESPAPATVTQGVPAAPAAEPSAAPAQPASEAPAPATMTTTVAAAPALAGASLAAAAAPQATGAPAAAAVAQPPASAQSAVPTTGTIVFQPRGETWVQVTDANGVVSLRKTLRAGETAGASGALPLAVVVGKADMTSVEVRGKAFDLAPVTRDNVARFEVK